VNKSYRVRIIVSAVHTSNEHAEVQLGTIPAEHIADVVSIVSGFSLAQKETPIEVHERLASQELRGAAAGVIKRAIAKKDTEIKSADPIADKPA